MASLRETARSCFTVGTPFLPSAFFRPRYSGQPERTRWPGEVSKALFIERGSHDDLLARKGRYYELYTGKSELT